MNVPMAGISYDPKIERFLDSIGEKPLGSLRDVTADKIFDATLAKLSAPKNSCDTALLKELGDLARLNAKLAVELNRGFAIPVHMHEIFSFYLRGGRLAHGEKRMVTIFMDGAPFEVKLSSSGFDVAKNPNHSEQWQILYGKNSPFAKKLRENFTLYPTDLKDTFYLEPEIACDEATLENLLDLSTLTDPQAALIERFGLTRYRKLNREHGEALKRNYHYRCQICGLNVGEFYGVNLVDCHHIAPFSESLNNDASNLLIVCPNHHRIIHAAKPTFDRRRKLYLYPNGYKEILQLNEHL